MLLGRYDKAFSLHPLIAVEDFPHFWFRDYTYDFTKTVKLVSELVNFVGKPNEVWVLIE